MEDRQREPRAIASAPRARRYTPPFSFDTVALRDLLALGGRDKLEARQLDFLRSVAKAGGPDGGSLFTAGDRNLLSKRCVAVIGARKASEIGRRRARQLGRQLAAEGVVVVSGLAEGIDTEALTGAIEAGGCIVAALSNQMHQLTIGVGQG